MLTLWSCRSFRCVFVRYDEPSGLAVQVWKGSDTVHSVPCADADAVAAEAENLFRLYCDDQATR